MLCIVLVALVSSVICADPHDDAIKSARGLVINYLNESKNELVPGLVIGVSVAGEQKWVEGFGIASIENNVTMINEAVMQIGSISKSFTVGLAARLGQQGKLSFDVPIRTYLSSDEFPDKTWNGSIVNIALRQILQMTSGIPNGPSDSEVGKCLRCINQKDRLVLMRDKELEFEPGIRFSYSNLAYELAGAVIESGLVNETFDVAMTDMIRNVLKLNRTAIVDSQLITPNIASFYRTEIINMTKHTTNAKSVYNSGMWGDVALNDFHASAGITATISDMLTYGQAWLDAYYDRNDVFLEQASVNDAWTPCSMCAPITYGMGWVIENVNNDRPSGSVLVWHSGGTVGCRSILAIYPETEIIVAAAVNLEPGTVDEFVLDGKIADLFATAANSFKKQRVYKSLEEINRPLSNCKLIH